MHFFVFSLSLFFFLLFASLSIFKFPFQIGPKSLSYNAHTLPELTKMLAAGGSKGVQFRPQRNSRISNYLIDLAASGNLFS